MAFRVNMINVSSRITEFWLLPFVISYQTNTLYFFCLEKEQKMESLVKSNEISRLKH